MKGTTAEWVSKAEGDYGAVRILRRSRKRNRFDVICFLCQQCAEKYLKARLNEAGIRFAKTHDLGTLLAMLKPVEPLWLGMDVALKNLTDFAVLVRYTGRSANRSTAMAAFKTCTKLRELARQRPGLKR
jgi:HEPN domain-containing protein